ncbi:hypothetical protein OTU49_006695 [Cherax quadricarinatus]|uniref:Mitogen-activated protein kinase kinase kinase n=1 Tax=Cherax quadricarinatus TaxID=27406 RepID=A0AAW0WLH3_CHEQU
MGLDTRGRLSTPTCTTIARPTSLCTHPACLAVHRPPTMVMLAWTGRPRPTQTYTHALTGGGSHNGDGGGGGGGGVTEGSSGADEEELGPFWDFLDNEIRPIKPLPSCPESQKIFSEHKEMARKYLVLQQEIFNLRKRKSALENKLSQAEKLEQLGNQRYQDKIRELESKRENLRHTHSRLRQQLEQIRTRQEEQQKQQQQQDDGTEVDLDHHLPLPPP